MSRPAGAPRRGAVKTFFDEDAARYDAAWEHPGAPGHALRSRQAAVLALAGDAQGAALDAGMGPGRLCAALAQRGWVVSGIDVSSEMVAAARARIPEAADRLQPASIESLPHPDGAFDLVTATGVLEYVDDVPAALRELARVLAPGGRAIVSIPNRYAPFGLWRRAVWYPARRALGGLVPTRRPPPPKRPPPVGLRRFRGMLRAAGLDPDAAAFANYQVALTPLDELLPRPAAWLARALERRAQWLGPAIATQCVISAHKRAAAAGAQAPPLAGPG